MEIKEVPQDKITTYAGHTKLMYATDAIGDYTTATSCGWETEEFVNKQAVIDLEEGTITAWHLVNSGERSPLYFHMYHCRYDLTSLSQSAGFFKWQLKRHLQPKYFNRLSHKKLLRYASAFNISIEQLKTVPKAL